MNRVSIDTVYESDNEYCGKEIKQESSSCGEITHWNAQRNWGWQL
ncbi:hypothetical protein [Pseudoteredinibacter isoporae]|uniref:Uncharacterized protein n=1 Tax=Pseudoteredinibacter isoporae TaxID=570281 RepID=A0A7X0JUF8_9GAMM|nr:hypothetical protein [Pseudoteredinibacter isoporae]MBB6522044.1 hypothetical protein [Pseudoteredinibacter isoporae]